MDTEKRICVECGKPLKAIGLSRSNGKLTDNFKDWSTRKCHKKCYQTYLFKKKYI